MVSSPLFTPEPSNAPVVATFPRPVVSQTVAMESCSSLVRDSPCLKGDVTGAGRRRCGIQPTFAVVSQPEATWGEHELAPHRPSPFWTTPVGYGLPFSLK